MKTKDLLRDNYSQLLLYISGPIHAGDPFGNDNLFNDDDDSFVNIDFFANNDLPFD